VAGTYRKELERHGIIERTDEWVQTSKGKRKAKVISVAVAPPKDQRDISLWGYARDCGTPAVESMSNEDLMRLIEEVDEWQRTDVRGVALRQDPGHPGPS
jgi:hypothetical protein